MRAKGAEGYAGGGVTFSAPCSPFPPCPADLNPAMVTSLSLQCMSSHTGGGLGVGASVGANLQIINKPRASRPRCSGSLCSR